MKIRNIGSFEVKAVGFGCMGLSHAYGIPSVAQAKKTLLAALEQGYDFLDTAALYGFGSNEKLIGEVLSQRRNEFVLASKCGLIRGADGKRCLDAHPETIRRTCEESLSNLRTETIDLYYLHRVDPKVALEDQIGTLADLVSEGKIRSIGLSEVSAETIRKAHAIYPVSAVQSEYSLWTRNPENQVLDTCAELDIAFVAFSPLGRGFFGGELNNVSTLQEGDLRLKMPRFEAKNYVKNLALLEGMKDLAAAKHCSLAQLALAWLLNKSPIIIPIPGTSSLDHAEENLSALEVGLNDDESEHLSRIFNKKAIYGERYDHATLASMET